MAGDRHAMSPGGPGAATILPDGADRTGRRTVAVVHRPAGPRSHLGETSSRLASCAPGPSRAAAAGSVATCVDGAPALARPGSRSGSSWPSCAPVPPPVRRRLRPVRRRHARTHVGSCRPSPRRRGRGAFPPTVPSLRSSWHRRSGGDPATAVWTCAWASGRPCSHRRTGSWPSSVRVVDRGVVTIRHPDGLADEPRARDCGRGRRRCGGGRVRPSAVLSDESGHCDGCLHWGVRRRSDVPRPAGAARSRAGRAAARPGQSRSPSCRNVRSRSIAAVCIWEIRDSVTPSTRPISARVMFS